MSRILTNPGLPPLGEASHWPLALLVAKTAKGDCWMNFWTSSDRVSFTLVRARSDGVPKVSWNRLVGVVSVVAMENLLSVGLDFLDESWATVCILGRDKVNLGIR